ncbi:LysR family transcriptional regulator [Anianabacter salinae]|uniref:LysR family transcriptional regulator n=1 Tax=Anianabacter salinae TaxID=2851023 RepID=UPI00225DD8DF|nr:LysR family transcriptional regulator [Anianabacter salinae]MBV0912171.1 LysR family transcriptional regulator [Anianabacter salinae]
MTIAAPRFNLRHLHACLAVRDHRGVSAASGAIHLSQPAITQGIAKLEEQLGAALFDRTSSGMLLTEPGALFTARAERALDLLRGGLDEAARGRRLPDGAVSITQLHALVALGDHGTFTLAARALGIAQPSVHRAARDAEAVVGVPLWTRSPTGVTLTRAARQIARAARLCFAELDQARQEIAAWRGEEAARLTIGALPLARSTVLPLALSELAAQRPGMRLRVVDGPYDDLLAALTSGGIDVMVGALRDPAPPGDVVQEPLFQDRLGVFAGPGHPLADGSASRDALLACPWIVPRPGTPTRAIFDRFMDGAVPPNLIETSSMVLVRNLLQQGTHLTMLSINQMRLDADHGLVVRLPAPLDDPPRTIGLTLRRGWRPTGAQAEALGILRIAARGFGSV